MKTGLKIPSLLYSYLATEMLAPFFASFIIMNCVFFLVKLIPFLNFVLELHIGPADFIRLLTYLFPNIFLYSIPMAAMMGVTIGFARLSSDSEILALKASGISILRILPPVILVAGLVAIFTGYCSLKLIPLSELAMKQLTYQLLKEKISKGIKPHVFTEALGDVVVYVENIDKATGNWQDVWVSDMRGVDNPLITMASSGRMTSSIVDMNVTIVLENGSLHRPSNENAQIVQFDRYQINIPLQPPSSKATRINQSNVMNRAELLEYAGRLGDNKFGRRILVEYHRRLVLPVGCLMLSLIGLPLGLQARPGKKAIGIQAGLGIFILYYIFFTLGRSFAEEAILPVGLAMWLPNILFFVLALFWIVRVSYERPLVPRFLSTFFANIFSRIRGIPRYVAQIFQKHIRGGGKERSAALGGEQTTAAKAFISGNPKSRVFHVPGCEYYNCRNCTLEFRDIQVALDAGFEPCRVCKQFMDL
ncbi:MAG: LPS export ABC transporter permease LptF [Desulforhopalus sp.]